ncbi:MAG: hypothetical protein AB4080_13010 [Trichodesmium sp.]
MIDLNSTSIQIQPGSNISGIVGGFVDNGDDFTLNFSGGSAVVDTSPVNASQLGLNIGDPVNVVVAEFDGFEIDTGFITRPDGSIILGNQPSFSPPPAPIPPNPFPVPPLNPPLTPMTPDPITGGIPNPAPSTGFDPLIAPQGNPIFGTVAGIVDNDEFFLDTNGTQVLVDANLPDSQFLGLFPGEQVNVTGVFDDGDFDAFSITRPDGSSVLPNFPSTPIPPVTAPPAPMPPAPMTPSPIVPTAPVGNTLFGTVFNTVDNDEFFLDANGTQVLVDANLPDSQFLNLRPGEQVNVVGQTDGQDFDAISITRADGSPVFPALVSTPILPVTTPPVTTPPNPIPPPPPVGNTLFGTVLNTVDNDEFFLDANGTQVLVDANLPDSQFLNLIPGEQVNVTGIFDDGDFDAFSITRPDGSVVAVSPGNGASTFGFDNDWDDSWDNDWDDSWDND